MKPIKVSFQAFASYARKTEVDFEKAGALFLIHGETGAGKTTILDAMMYALYGESSGGERSEMRCALPEAADIPTEVEFIFEIGSKRYKFTRYIGFTPRSKKLETKQDCFHLDENSTEFIPFFENPKQVFVRQKAEELTGLSAEQFRQVIILPQGKFERLLTSGSDEKEKILSTLFGAEKFTLLSKKLAEMAEDERRTLKTEETELNALLAAEKAESIEQLSEESKELSEKLNELSPKVKAAGLEFEIAQKALAEANAVTSDFDKLKKAKLSLDELNGKAEEISRINRLLSMHEKALKARPEYISLCGARQDISARKKALSDAENAFTAAKAEHEKLLEKRAETAGTEERISALKSELAVLEEFSEAYEKIDLAKKSAAAFAKKISEKASQLEIANNSVQKTDADISAAKAKQEQILSEFSRKIPELTKKKALLDKGRESYENLRTYENALNGILAEIEKLSESEASLESKKNAFGAEYDRLYRIYFENAAAELSSKLEEGRPCPVCGSLSHPAPAHFSAENVTSEQVKTARDNFDAAGEELSKIKEAKAARQERVNNAQKYISDCKNVILKTGYSPEIFRETADRLSEAEAQDRLIPELKNRISALETQKQDLENSKKKISNDIEDLKQQKTAAETEIAVLNTRLSKDCPDKQSYILKINGIKAEIGKLSEEKKAADLAFENSQKHLTGAETSFKQATEELFSAENRLSSAEAAFLQKLSAAEIPDEESFRTSLLPEAAAEEYSRNVKEYSDSRLLAENTVKELSEKLSGKEPPDTAKLSEKAALAKENYDDLSKEHTLCSDRITHLGEVLKNYSERYEKFRAAAEKNGKRIEFARFMRGDKGISFTRYVLSMMLSLVVSEANRILSDIHGGMFRLRVKTELAANSKSGLDLEVENTLSEGDVRYGVKGLSGGEKFLISLALSLGLSAVAQSRSGGIRIDAMFIDEGFGSLDSNSLKEAISVLCSLSNGKSSIGIISHVEELRNVIPCCIEVKKTAQGGSMIIDNYVVSEL